MPAERTCPSAWAQVSYSMRGPDGAQDFGEVRYCEPAHGQEPARHATRPRFRRGDFQAFRPAATIHLASAPRSGPDNGFDTHILPGQEHFPYDGARITTDTRESQA